VVVHFNTLLKNSQNGREHEEEEISSYWITLRKREWNLKDIALSLSLSLSVELSLLIKRIT
jgi:hypothetical protein